MSDKSVQKRVFSINSSCKWNDDMIARFLGLYRGHVCLWDCRNELYKSKEAREEAYRKLVAAMDIPGMDVINIRNKIRIIRNTYTLELKKHLYRFGGKEYYPMLSWFPIADSFLRDVVQLKTGPRNVTQSAPMDEIQILEDEGPSNDGDHQESAVYLPEPEQVVLETPLPSTRTGKKRRRSQLDIEIEAEELLEQSVAQLQQPEEDEYDLFAKYIACQLKKLPAHHALVCQDRIHQFIIQQRLELEQEWLSSRTTKVEPADLN